MTITVSSERDVVHMGYKVWEGSSTIKMESASTFETFVSVAILQAPRNTRQYHSE
jgi:hypothetical protein